MTSEIRSADMEDEAFAEASTFTTESVPSALPPSFAGLDAGSYPGQRAMDAFQAAGFSVTGFYLTHAPARWSGGSVDAGWIAAANYLSTKGWGLAPIYVGAEPAGSSKVPPPNDPLSNAQVDAAEAVALAQRAGLEPGRTIFLDVEKAFAANTSYESYVLKWLESVRKAGYGTALYCFPAQTAWCVAQGIKIWTVHLNKSTGSKDATGTIHWSVLTSPLPADPIDNGAIATQGRFYCQAAQQTVELDYDRWLVKDPSSL